MKRNKSGRFVKSKSKGGAKSSKKESRKQKKIRVAKEFNELPKRDKQIVVNQMMKKHGIYLVEKFLGVKKKSRKQKRKS